MWKKICLLLCATLLLTGCVKIETDVTIHKDGSAVVKERFLLSKQLLAMSQEQDPFAEALEKYKDDASVQVKEYSTEDMKGIEATKNIEDITNDKWNTSADSKNLVAKNPDGKFISVKKGFFKDVYILDAQVDTIPKEDNPMSAQEKQMQAAVMSGLNANEIFSFSYIIRTPVKADSHNATEADESNFVYTWKIKFNAINEMKLQFTVYKTVNIVFSLFAVIIILLITANAVNTKKEET